ncbi:MAG: hypothetical protein IGS03_10995 [Candidatus Sericytochromatia bacterium]|nr:hypothetical protein [Candidatus Sericytochromatia bacterium]
MPATSHPGPQVMPWVIHPFADLKLGIWVPGYSDPQQPFIIKWSDDPRLCQIFWSLFQASEPAEEQPLLHATDIALLRHMGLLLPFEKLSLRGILASATDESTALQTYQPPPESKQNWLSFNFQARLQVEVDVPLRHQHVRAQLFDWERQPDICRLLWRFFTATHKHFSVQEARILQQLGLLCAPDKVPQAVSYTPRLQADDPLYPYAARVQPLAESLQLNPSWGWQEGPDLPEAVQLPFVSDRIQMQPPLLWLKDPRNHIWTPFQVPAEHKERLQALLEGKLPLTDLTEAERRTWQDAGLLLTASRPDRQTLQKQLAATDFCVIPGLLNPLQIAAARHYLRSIHQEGYLLNGDPFVSNRFGMHNEPMCRFLHQQFYPVISEITQTPLKASYCYFALYHSGARLPRHTDREQCAWNVSLVLDTDPEQTRAQAWPIYLELPQGIEAVRLEMGDAIVYRGSRYPHWRNPLPSGSRVSVCFFHFVDADFDGLLF